jgi:D-alanine-D-alanine ligase-like ATP-grasp enzyme/acylphosphatase
MSFRPTASGTPAANFAIHVQVDDEKKLHTVVEAKITVGHGRSFPNSAWPVVEELCRQLGAAEIDSSGTSTVRISEEAISSLERQGKGQLAEQLRGASQGRSFYQNCLMLRRFGFSAYVRKMAREAALRKVTKLFERALRKFATDVTQGSSPAGDVNVENYYERRLNQIDRSFCFPEPPLPCLKGSPVNIYDDAAYLAAFPKDATKGHLLEREALIFGLSVLRFPNGSFIASDSHGKRMNFKWSRSPASSGVALGLCNHKEATRARLIRCGLPVARGRLFASQERSRIAAYAARIGYPVVCKPAAGVRGIGVTTNIQNEEELFAALDLYGQCPLGQDDLLIEEHVTGTDYRIVVVGSEVVSVVCRETASVVGTGLHTIADLLLYKNQIRLRNPHLRRRLIEFDDAAQFQLDRAGLTLNSVPESGEVVRLANSNNISRGGDSIELLEELHPTIRDTVVRAVEAVPGLRFCGVDMLLENHTKPIDQQTAAIVELNAHGAIGTGQYPMWGLPRNVARHFLLYCAAREGVEVSNSPASHLSLLVQVRGKVTRVGYRRWFRRKAEEFGVTGGIAGVDRNTVTATIEGGAAPVAALVNAAVRGPAKAVPYWVDAKHVPPGGYSKFSG